MREMKDSGIEWIGKIPETWEVKRIKHLFTIISGATPGNDADNWDGDIFWITPADYKTKDKYVSQGKRNLTKKGFDSCSTCLIPAGNVIFSKRAPIGTVAINTKELCTNQGCLSCISKFELSNAFYYYVLSVGTEYFELLGTGTTFKEISANTFANCKLPFPSLQIQERIVEFLDAKCAEIDALTADIQAQIDTLEQYKRSIITEAVTKGLDPDTEMRDSGIPWIGELPRNWHTLRKLSYATQEDISYGIVKLLEPDDESGIKVIRCSDVMDGYISKDNIRTVTQSVSAEYARTILQGGEVVLNIRGSLGGCAVVPDSMVGYNIAREVAKINIKKQLFNRYLMYFLLSTIFSNYLQNYLVGSVYIGLNIETLKSCPVPLPPMNEQVAISEYLDKKCARIDSIVADKKAELETLADYKNSLIFEYVTGKKEVPAS